MKTSNSAVIINIWSVNEVKEKKSLKNKSSTQNISDNVININLLIKLNGIHNLNW